MEFCEALGNGLNRATKLCKHHPDALPKVTILLWMPLLLLFHPDAAAPLPTVLLQLTLLPY